LAGGEFMAGWDGLTIGDLFERIRISMPQNAPGSLSGQQNADILSFMFSSNKFPAGTAELPKEAGILKQIKFEVKKP
jgi:S-disulfanyl-L-cysteine oxidoreductase SoxD